MPLAFAAYTLWRVAGGSDDTGRTLAALAATAVMLLWMAHRIEFQIRAAPRTPAWAARHVLLTVMFWLFLALFCLVMGGRLADTVAGVLSRG